MGKPRAQQRTLRGWQEIARFLGQPVSVAPMLGEIRNASHPQGSVCICLAGRTEPLGGTGNCRATRDWQHRYTPRSALPHPFCKATLTEVKVKSRIRLHRGA